jgi:2-iminoacetate synthase ThiH
VKLRKFLKFHLQLLALLLLNSYFLFEKLKGYWATSTVKLALIAQEFGANDVDGKDRGRWVFC